MLFDRFLQFRHLIVSGLAQFGVEAMRRFPPAEGDRVVDIGCGIGDSTAQLAELVGPTGSVLGDRHRAALHRALRAPSRRSRTRASR